MMLKKVGSAGSANSVDSGDDWHLIWLINWHLRTCAVLCRLGPWIRNSHFQMSLILTLPLSNLFFGAEFFCLSHSFVKFRCRSLTWPFGDSHGFGAACASASSCTMLVSIADIDGLLGISHDCCSKKGCCSETQALDSEEKTLCCGAHSSSTWFHGKWSQMGPEVQASISGRSHFGGKIRPDVPSDSVWLSAVGILVEALLLLNISVDWSVWSWWKVSLIWCEICWLTTDNLFWPHQDLQTCRVWDCPEVWAHDFRVLACWCQGKFGQSCKCVGSSSEEMLPYTWWWPFKKFDGMFDERP